MIDDNHWSLRAACQGMSAARSDDVFFGTHRGAVKRPRAFCASCPVAADCREFALSLDGSEAHGTYAGLTGRQRDDIRRTRAKGAA